MVYELVVNHNLTVADMVAAGNYDKVDFRITEANFPKTGTGEVQVSAELIHLNRFISRSEAISEIDRLGFRPATIHELLDFGSKYPHIQREFVIVALGSFCWDHTDLCVAYLSKFCSSLRGLGVWRGSWYKDDRFLGVRKPAC